MGTIHTDYITDATINGTELSAADVYILGEPKYVKLSYAEYHDLIEGKVDWQSKVGHNMEFNSLTGLGYAGLIIPNKRGADTDGEVGDYIGLSDNTGRAPSDPNTGFSSVKTISQENPTAWDTLPEDVLSFNMSGDNNDSVSEVLKRVGTDISTVYHNDTLIVDVVSLRKDRVDSDSLRYEHPERHEGVVDFYPKKKLDAEGGKAKQNYLEDKASEDSDRISVLINPYISKNIGSWVADNGEPSKSIRVYSDDMKYGELYNQAGVTAEYRKTVADMKLAAVPKLSSYNSYFYKKEDVVEASSVCFNPNNNYPTFMVLGDSPGNACKIHEFDFSNQMNELSSSPTILNVPGVNKDIEGLCHVSGNRFAVCSEFRKDGAGTDSILLFDYTPGTTMSTVTAYDIDIDQVSDLDTNKGLEGISYNAAKDVFYVVKEGNPWAVYEVTLGTAPSTTVKLLFSEDTVSWDPKPSQLSDIYYHSDLNQLLLSDHGTQNVPAGVSRLWQCDLEGNLVTSRDIAPHGTPGVPYDQIESIVLSPDNRFMVIAGESNPQAKSEIGLYVTNIVEIVSSDDTITEQQKLSGYMTAIKSTGAMQPCNNLYNISKYSS